MLGYKPGNAAAAGALFLLCDWHMLPLALTGHASSPFPKFAAEKLPKKCSVK